jgi:hypothetical protein
VHSTLESVNTPSLFAVGDVACLVENPRPKAGVFAVRGEILSTNLYILHTLSFMPCFTFTAGPPLARNILKKLQNPTSSNLERYVPQSLFLGIIGTGTSTFKT